MAFVAPSSSSVPQPFQPLLNDDFLKSLYSNINDQQARDVGFAESDAAARGLEGSTFEASGIASANQTADTSRNNALQGFLYNLAGMKENENIITEGQQFSAQQQATQNTFQAQQNDLNRQLGYAGLEEQTKLQNMRDVYGLYTGAAEAVGSGIGAYSALY